MPLRTNGTWLGNSELTMQIAQFDAASADVVSLTTGDTLVVPNAGPTKVIVPFLVVGRSRFGTVPYSRGTTDYASLGLTFNGPSHVGASNISLDDLLMIPQSALGNIVRIGLPGPTLGPNWITENFNQFAASLQEVVGRDLVLWNGSGHVPPNEPQNYVSGDGGFTLTIFYAVLDFS